MKFEFVDFDLTQYLMPIEARLSMDDVTPPGRWVAFDTSSVLTPETGDGTRPRTDDR
jgi:hypothetical protein